MNNMLNIRPNGKCFKSFSNDFITKLEESNYDFNIMNLYIDNNLALTIPKHKLMVLVDLDLLIATLALLCNTDKVYNLLDANN